MLLRSMLAAATITALSFAPFAGSLSAQDADVEADVMLSDEDAVLTDDADLAADADVAAEAEVDTDATVATDGRTFGFRTRGNCGEFKYWDGTTCLDARDKVEEKK